MTLGLSSDDESVHKLSFTQAAAAPAAPSSTQSLALNCQQCRDARVYCSRTLPCERCVRMGFECNPQTGNRKPRKRPRRGSGKGGAPLDDPPAAAATTSPPPGVLVTPTVPVPCATVLRISQPPAPSPYGPPSPPPQPSPPSPCESRAEEKDESPPASPLAMTSVAPRILHMQSRAGEQHPTAISPLVGEFFDLLSSGRLHRAKALCSFRAMVQLSWEMGVRHFTLSPLLKAIGVEDWTSLAEPGRCAFESEMWAYTSSTAPQLEAMVMRATTATTTITAAGGMSGGVWGGAPLGIVHEIKATPPFIRELYEAHGFSTIVMLCFNGKRVIHVNPAFRQRFLHGVTEEFIAKAWGVHMMAMAVHEEDFSTIVRDMGALNFHAADNPAELTQIVRPSSLCANGGASLCLCRQRFLVLLGGSYTAQAFSLQDLPISRYVPTPSSSSSPLLPGLTPNGLAAALLAHQANVILSNSVPRPLAPPLLLPAPCHAPLHPQQQHPTTTTREEEEHGSAGPAAVEDIDWTALSMLLETNG